MGAPWRPRGPDDLDEDERARIRYQVLSSLRGHKATPIDRLYDALAIAALPAPHLVRAVLGATFVLGLLAGATVASADTLPTEPLYPVKLATEQVRLALAQSAEDRASVRLSMAEHRLGEAERLALRGMQSEAIVAGSTYAADLAAAAADLASIEQADPEGAAAVAQLRQRLAEQQAHAAQVARELAAEPAGAVIAPVFRTVASFAPPRASGTTMSEAIAEHGADVAGQIATVADEIAQASEARSRVDHGASPPSPQRASDAPPASTPDVAGPIAPASPAGPPPAATARDGQKRTETTDETKTSASTGRAAAGGAVPAEHAAAAPPVTDPRTARDAAERAKHEAEQARDAAERAKHDAEKAKEGVKAPPRAGSHSEQATDKSDAAGHGSRAETGAGKGQGKARP